MTGLRSKDTSFLTGRPSRAVAAATTFSALTGMFDSAVSPTGTSTAKSNVALRFGSSKQGKVRRAWQGSKKVLSTCCIPASGSASELSGSGMAGR